MAALFAEAPAQAEWNTWVRSLDVSVRARVKRGAEDSVSNLLQYGSSFTELPAAGGSDDAAARTKVLAAALAGDPSNERLRMAQSVVATKGLTRAAVEKILAANLARFRAEQADYEERLRRVSASPDPDEKLFLHATLYSARGLSSDTSLLPNWAIEDTLRVMKEKGAAPAEIRRIAIIGPGLDFADKRDGFDFYPVQTIQPFAVLETGMRMGFRDATVTAFDLNPAVLSHIDRLKRSGAYRRQLVRDRDQAWKAEPLRYWEQFGSVIGTTGKAAAVPQPLPSLAVRGVQIRAEFASRISAMDMNIVTQTTEQRFDLIVATNILVYYDRLQQAIALANIARMLNPGGVFLSNTVLPAQRPASLAFVGRRTVTYGTVKEFGDDFVVYRKKAE
ncbi:MAG: CheR family methyltransferase [Bryobacteraceae bacterium]